MELVSPALALLPTPSSWLNPWVSQEVKEKSQQRGDDVIHTEAVGTGPTDGAQGSQFRPFWSKCTYADIHAHTRSSTHTRTPLMVPSKTPAVRKSPRGPDDAGHGVDTLSAATLAS